MIGINLLAQFLQDRNGVFTYLTTLKPPAVVVMDDMPFATEVKRILPNCLVVHRSWHPDDAEFHLKWSPDQFAAAYLTNVPSGIIVQCLNEPYGYANLIQLGNWCKTVMGIATSRNIRLCLPNFGVGNPLEDVAQLDGLWRAFQQYPQHVLSVHEYFQWDPTLEPYHTGRFKAIVTRFQQLGIPAPKIIISEAGRDVGGGVDDGWRTVFDEPTYATKLKQQAEIYRNTAVMGMCVFCMGKGGGDRWRNFDFETAGIVKQTLVDYNRSLPVTLLPKPDLTPLHQATVVAAASIGSNVRDSADTSGAIVKQLFAGNTIQISEKSFNNDGYNWYQLGVNEYVADTDAFDWTPKTAPVTSVGLTQAQWDRLNNANTAIKTAAAEIDQLLSEVKPPIGGGGF